MLRNDVCYPYPVLRTFLSDYRETFFSSDIRIETTQNVYRLSYDFSVNNDRINMLIKNGVLSYAIFLSCKRTYMREMRYLANESGHIDIPAEDVHYKVEYISYIVAMQDIEHYSDEDLEYGFEGLKFRIPKGSVFGIGRSGVFDALFNDDIIKDAGTIIQVKGSDHEKYMKVDLNESTIIVRMPKEQSTIYKNMSRKPDKINMLHAVVTIPALTEAICRIAKTRESNSFDSDQISERAWFVTIAKAIKELSETVHESEQLLYDYPLRTAQMIMKNNSKVALQLIENKI